MCVCVCSASAASVPITNKLKKCEQCSLYEQKKKGIYSVITSLQKEKSLLAEEHQAVRDELLTYKDNHTSVLESLDNQSAKMGSKARAK